MNTLVLTDTMRLEASLDDARIEHEAIQNEGYALIGQMHALVKAYAAKHRCHAGSALDHLDDLMVDLIDDATGPSYRNVVRLENELSAIEFQDERMAARGVL